MEIKVMLYAGENDDYVELWKALGTEEGEDKYYGRYTYADLGTWYYVSDPLGYCELSHQVADDVVFICCDDEGNEQCRYSNADPNPLVKFETYVKRKWEEYVKATRLQTNTENNTKNFWSMCWDGTTTNTLNQWLLSFKDPELYGDVAKDYDENWCGCWKEHEISYEALKGSHFTYLGNKYQFVKVTHKHDICGVEWYEFICANAPFIVTDTNFNPVDDWSDGKRYWIQTLAVMGNWYDTSIKGTMYDVRTARQVMKKLLKAIYEGKEISKIYDSYGFVYERFFNYDDAAKYLLDGNYNIKHISEVVKAECENHTFEFVDDPTIETRYPGVQRDRKYNYDDWGRRFR